MTGETPTERRLRNEAFRCANNGQSITADAIDAGREAIALLREHSAIATNAKWAARRRALLARCEQEG